MKRTIFILMMMIFGVSVPSLAQQTVQKRFNTSTETQQATPSQQSPYSDPNIIPNRIDDFKFTVNSKDHTATITKCNNLYGTVVIPSSFIYAGEKYTVTKIDNQAFRYEGKITSIIIPNTVTSIGREAFRMCTELTSIIIPDGITVISYQAFEGCSSLTSIIIPNTVEIIGVRAFEGCWSLCSIDIPNSVTEICEYAFFRCFSLTSIKLSENLTIIGAAAFARCNLKSVYIPNSVKEIGGGAFSENKQLQFASIPNTITFADMNGKRAVRNGVFVDTPLKKVTRRKENSNQTISDTSWQWFHIDDPNAVNNARRQESYSSYSSNSRSSSSSSSSSSNDSEDTYSCTVHLKFKDGDTVYKGSGKVYFKGFLSTGGIKYYTDSKGNATIRWPKSKGKVIDTITLDRNIGFNEAYTKEGLNLEDGGNYTICLDCR